MPDAGEEDCEIRADARLQIGKHDVKGIEPGEAATQIRPALDFEERPDRRADANTDTPAS